jgi:hypothetical protein
VSGLSLQISTGLVDMFVTMRAHDDGSRSSPYSASADVP